MAESENFLIEHFKNELEILRILVNSTKDIICIKDGEGRWLYANDEDLNLFELNGVDYIGKKDSELANYSKFYHDAFMYCEITDEEAWKKKSLSRKKEKIPLIKGGFRIFDTVKMPLFNKDNTRSNLVVIGRDITDLEKEKSYNESITSVLPDPFFILNSDDVFIDFHANDLQLLAYSPQGFIGKNIYDIFPKELSDSYHNAAQRVLKSGIKESIEYRLNTKTKQEYFRAQLVRFDDNKILSSIHDITESKKLQIELEQFRETHIDILNNIKEAVYILDKDNEFLYVNRAATEMYGYEYEEFIGNTPAFLSPDGMNDLDYVVDLLNKAYNGESQFFDFYGLAKDGRIFPKEVSCSPVNYYGKKGVISVARDVSIQKQVELDLKKARDKALESDRLKSSFLAILTHELRTPLNAVIGFSEIMHDEAKEESTKYYSKIIYDKGLDLLNIINDTLQMALIDAGEVELRHESFIIGDFIKELTIITKTLNIKPEVKLNEAILDMELKIISDKTKLSQIMLNLIRNAIKFTERGSVTYGIRLDENNEAYFFVEDTGSGISEDNISFVFQAFRQVEESISRSHGGLGLGLTISKELVHLLGGELKVKSQIDKGSVFYFQLPGIIAS